VQKMGVCLCPQYKGRWDYDYDMRVGMVMGWQLLLPLPDGPVHIHTQAESHPLWHLWHTAVLAHSCIERV